MSTHRLWEGLMHGMPGLHGSRRATIADTGRAPAQRDGPDHERRPWSLLVLLSVAQFMVILDATIVNVALPSIARSLSFTAGALQWVVTAYVLLSGGLVLLGGRASDVAGRRRVFLAGLAVFTAASLASGLAPSVHGRVAGQWPGPVRGCPDCLPRRAGTGRGA